MESLSLTGRDLPRLPAALTAATALTSLSLPGFTATRLATAAEWDACLPQSLRSLALRHCGLTDLPPFRQLAGELRARCMACFPLLRLAAWPASL